MRVGIAGAGFMARTHAAAWKTLGHSVTAVLDTPDPTGRELAHSLGATLWDSVQEMAGSVDVFDICLPTDLHAPTIENVSPFCKAIFCEKPLARTVSNARRVANLCDQNGTLLGIGHVVRFFPEYSTAVEAVRRGEVGLPALLRFSRCTFMPRNPWFLDRTRSGGVVFDLMIHDLDFATIVAGPAKTVFARLDAPSEGAARGADHCHAVVTHRSGAITHLEASWRLPAPEFEVSFEIAGDRGLLVHKGEWSRDLRLHLRPPEETASPGRSDLAVPVAVESSPDDPYVREMRAFAAAVESGTPAPVSAADGVSAVVLAAAIEESIATGRAVTVGGEVER